MSYNYTIGRDCEEWAIGQKWKFGKFTRNVWADLAKEGRRLMPDPVAVALESIDLAVAKDAETIRRLQISDAEELKLAEAAGRDPVLLAPQYVPITKGLEERAYEKKTSYLSAGSPELNSFLVSCEGQSYLFFLLLRKHHPDITDETAYDIYRDLAENAGRDGRMTTEAIINTCNGRGPTPSKNDAAPA